MPAEKIEETSGPQITQDQNDRIKALVGLHGPATAIFQPEGVGPYGDLVVVWPHQGIVVHPTADFTLMKRVA